jgi:methyltransferase (TIGR00027 family)
LKPGQASTTAKVIAAGTLLLASDPRTAAQVAPGAAPLCQKFLAGTRADRWLAASVVHPLTRALWRWVESITLPGIVSHYWRRKCWIESRCRSAVAQGCRRVIVLGAGFDTLAYRLAHELDGLSIIEIDHPATQAAKRKALPGDEAGAMRYMPLDLASEPLPAEIVDDAAATVVVIEGLLMYLPPAEVGRLFDVLRAFQAARLRVIFSFMTLWPDGSAGFRPRSGLVERWLARRNEPFTWALEPAAARDFLAAHGFRLMELAFTRDFTNALAANALEGENLATCEPTQPGGRGLPLPVACRQE